MMNNYITIHVSDKPVVIFKKHIVAIAQNKTGKAEVMTVAGSVIIADEDYDEIVTNIIF